MNNLVTEEMVNGSMLEISTHFSTAQNSIQSLNNSIKKLEEDIDIITQGGIWETEENNRQQTLDTLLENIRSCYDMIDKYRTSLQDDYFPNIEIYTRTEYEK